jgi:hypothetical protein
MHVMMMLELRVVSWNEGYGTGCDLVMHEDGDCVLSDICVG